jgi:hypothetical protein
MRSRELLSAMFLAIAPMIHSIAKRLCTVKGGKPIFPPDKNAKLQKGKSFPALRERGQAIRRIQELGDEGRSLWKQEIGYHRSSLVETFMFRYKTILGDRLAARKKWTQATEVAIKLDVLNRMTELGMSKSYKVVS